ncbi:MAG: helix-turn-helix domain-containing protein [Solirubrobacteraceae bacterium]
MRSASPAAMIRAARRSSRLTQEQLAQRLGTSQSAVAKLEGPSANPTVATFERALRATGHRLELVVSPEISAVDEGLIRRQLELTPGQRIAAAESLYVAARNVALAGERARGELA